MGSYMRSEGVVWGLDQLVACVLLAGGTQTI
jgi:hypothetical protein